MNNCKEEEYQGSIGRYLTIQRLEKVSAGMVECRDIHFTFYQKLSRGAQIRGEFR
jgi:hypothetical protein